MESIETLVRLLAAFVTASLAPAPQYIDPGSELRMPLLSQAAAPAEELAGVTRWQQVDEPPSDLPDDSILPDDEEHLDADLGSSDETAPPSDEPLDAPLGDEVVDDELVDDGLGDEVLVDDGLTSAQLDDDEFFDDEEPLDAEFDDGFIDDEEFPEDDLIDDPTLADEPLDAPQADPFAGDTSSPAPRSAQAPASNTAVLPEGFGSGETFVSNPPAGAEAAAVPDDCDALVQSGRAVVGVGCGGGDGDDPWWLPLVGQTQPASAPGTGSAPASDFPFNQSGPPPGFPFDDNSGPFASERGGIVIAAPSRSNDRETVSVIEHDGELLKLRGDDNVERTNLVRTEQIKGNSEPDNERVEAIKRQRAEVEASLPVGRQAAQSSRPGVRTATQPANAKLTKRATARAKAEASAQKSPVRAGARLNPCQNAKRIANSPKSARYDKQLAKARANCRQFKKTQERPAGR